MSGAVKIQVAASSEHTIPTATWRRFITSYLLKAI